MPKALDLVQGPGTAELTGGRETGVHRPPHPAALLHPKRKLRDFLAFPVGGAFEPLPPS